ncbi:hypothetical protein R1flu_008548 [Riccia fluitans]|uniref:Reverse transcriptase zinc-binding domain-containing protein n=1 Tax=Riccia fluitans TaxID=41844 RepID=A0ABD1YC78_9MARC
MVPDLFLQLGPVIQMPSTMLTLTYEDAWAQILWDTKNEILPYVEIELIDEDGKPPIILRQEVRFLEPGKCRKCQQAIHGRTPCHLNQSSQGHKRKAEEDARLENPPSTRKTNFWNPEHLADFQRSQAAETSKQSNPASPPSVPQASQKQPALSKRSTPLLTKWMPKSRFSELSPASHSTQDPDSVMEDGLHKGSLADSRDDTPTKGSALEASPPLEDLSLNFNASTSGSDLGTSMGLKLHLQRFETAQFETPKVQSFSHNGACGNSILGSVRSTTLTPDLSVQSTIPAPNQEMRLPTRPKFYMSPDGVASYEPGPPLLHTQIISTFGGRTQFLTLPPEEVNRRDKSSSSSPPTQSASIGVPHNAHTNIGAEDSEVSTAMQISNDRIQEFVRLLQAGSPPSNPPTGFHTSPKSPQTFSVNIEPTMAPKSNKWKSRSSPAFHKTTPENRTKRKRFLPYRKWILTGDWNSVKQADQTSGYKNLMVGEEESNFRSLKLKFMLSDAYDLAEERSGPHYTCHVAYGSEFRWATLDRIYLPLDVPWFEAIEAINHQAEFTLSDHMPVTITLALGGRLPRGVKLRTYFKFNAHLMAQPETNRQLRELWEFETKDVDDPIKAYCKGWAVMRNHMKVKQWEQSIQISQIDELGKKLKACHEALPLKPSDEQKAEVFQLETEKRKREHACDRLARIWSRARYIAQGDAPTKYFLSLHKKQIVQHDFSKLKLSDGSETTCKTAIMKEATKVFAALYTSENRTEETRRDTTFINSKLRNKLSDAQRMMLEEMPSKNEINDSLYSFPKGKAPGIDGTNAESLQAVWDFIEPAYFKMIQHFWITNVLPHTWLEVPRGLDRSGLSQEQKISYCLDRMVSRLNLWSNRLLSFEGRVILIKHILLSIPVFFLSSVGITKKVAESMETIARHFLWGRSEDGNHKRGLVPWSALKRGKRFGGLGFKDVWRQGVALFSKHMGDFMANANTAQWHKLLNAFIDSQRVKRSKNIIRGGYQSQELLLLKRPTYPGKSYTAKALITAWTLTTKNLLWSPERALIPEHLTLRDLASLTMQRDKLSNQDLKVIMAELRAKGVMTIHQLWLKKDRLLTSNRFRLGKNTINLLRRVLRARGWLRLNYIARLGGVGRKKSRF